MPRQQGQVVCSTSTHSNTEYRKWWNEANRGRYLASQRAAKRRERERDPDYVNARHRAWVAANPDVARNLYKRRRARQHQATVVAFTAEQLEQRLSMFGHLCWMCRGPANSVDHVKPLTKGGLHTLANLRPACIPCNTSKNNRWPWPEVA